MKRMKKLMAAILAVVMVLGLNATAFAAVVDSNGNQTGTFTNEGAVPPEVFSVVLPTVNSNAFDLIVDPHNLIRQSAAAERAKSAYNGKTFEEGAYAFFAKTEDNETTYGSTTETMKVVNKSSTPVTVKLDAVVDSATSANAALKKINFVDSASAVQDVTKKAAMYLGVVNGETETPITDTIYPDLEVTIPANLQPYIIGSKFEWVDGVSGKLKKGVIDTFSASNGTINLPAKIASDGANKYSISDPSDGWVTNTVTTDAATKLAATVTSNTRVMTINYPENNKATAVAKITFYFDATQTKPADDVTGNIALKAWDGSPYATVKTQTANKDGAYSIQVNDAGSGYVKVIDGTIENDDFPSESFNLKVAINQDDAWDNISAASTLSNALKITWTVKQYITPADPDVTVLEAATKNAEQAKIAYTAGKGAATVAYVLNASYTADGKLTVIENGADALSVDKTNKEITLTVATKMLAEGVPETCKIAFLMTDGTVKEVPVNFTTVS